MENSQGTVARRQGTHKIAARFTYGRTPTALLRDPDLSARAKLLYALLDDFAGKQHSAFPAAKTLARLCGCADKTVRRALRELADAGWISIDERPGTSSIYWLEAFAQPREDSTLLHNPGEVIPSEEPVLHSAGESGDTGVQGGGHLCPDSLDTGVQGHLTRQSEPESLNRARVRPASRVHTAEPQKPACARCFGRGWTFAQEGEKVTRTIGSSYDRTKVRIECPECGGEPA